MDTAVRCPVWSSLKDKKEGKMYGILLESVQFFVIKDVGEDVWHQVLQHAGMKNMVFSTHTTYSDELMVKLATSCCHVTKREDFNHWMTFFGTCFVEFCSLYGYDNLLQVSGRTYRDFLHGIDNIHEIIRFSYPRLQSPSFLVLFEDREGCVLLYQSKRRGFKHYVKGQLSQIAKMFYKVTLNITILEEDFIDNICSVKFRLDFDNSVYSSKFGPAIPSGTQSFSSISGDIFLKVFPFCVVFDNQLMIKNVGHSMAAFLKGDNLIGCHLREKFHIRRPLIPCIWSRILRFQRVIFELEYVQDDSDLSDLEDGDGASISKTDTDPPPPSSTANQKCLLRGEMKYIEDWDMVAFLCTPLLNNLKDLQAAGLYINDLNMFDMSRDMVMAGWQHASQLERSIEQQRDKSELISENLGKIEEWKKKSDSLLYSMIPQSIAERLKSGMNPIDTCQLFDMVTIMFVYMVGFADICTSSSPMEIVKCINNLFVVFDQVVDQYEVFKVETLGDAVYMVAGGVPDRDPKHAVNVAMVALKLQEKARTVYNQIGSDCLNTRIGMHSGSVVGGVVGRRMPQYCLFGDTVNTASRMQTYSLPGRIHVSEPCNECLQGSKFITVNRGKVNIKGKGEMQTYWLLGEEGEELNQTALSENEMDQTVTKSSSCDNALDLYGMHASTSYSQIELQPWYRRPSYPPAFPLQTSRQSLASKHGLRKSEADLFDVETCSDYLDLTFPSSRTTCETSIETQKRSGLKPGEDPRSFFIDNTVTSVDHCDKGAVGDVERLGTVDRMNKVMDDTYHNSNEKDQKQASYANSEEICKVHSMCENEIGTSDTEKIFSMFCPFFSTNVDVENVTRVSDALVKKTRIPQTQSQGHDRANTASGVWESCTQVPSIRLEQNKTASEQSGESMPESSSQAKGTKSTPFLTQVPLACEDVPEYSATASASKPKHSLCPFTKVKEETNHVDAIIICEQQTHLNNKDFSEESDSTSRLQSDYKSVGTTQSSNNKTVCPTSLPVSIVQIEDSVLSSDSTVLLKGGERSAEVLGNGDEDVEIVFQHGLLENNSSALDVEISSNESEESRNHSVDGKLIEKIRKLCCISPCNEYRYDKQDRRKSTDPRKLSTSMTYEEETQSQNDVYVIENTPENLNTQSDTHDQLLLTNHASCHKLNGSCCETEYKNSAAGCNGLSVDRNTRSVMSNGHGHLFKNGVNNDGPQNI